MMTAQTQHGFMLSSLLDGLVDVPAGQNRPVTGLALDSRLVQPGDLFLACAGRQVHGARFIEAALAAGAAAVLWEPPAPAGLAIPATRVPALAAPGLSGQVGVIADRFFAQPSAHLDVTGITGTNGKTSCSQFLAQVFSADAPCGVIGTLGYGVYGDLREGGHTTPDALTCHRLLADMLAAGATRAVMEVSSHALDQGRVAGVRFDTALFTNLTRDHLDYHGDMSRYAAAKQRLFATPGLRHAVINLDDAAGRELLQALPAGVQAIGYGLESRGPSPVVQGRALQLSGSGLYLQVETPWGSGELRSPLLGRFNASNLLAVLGAALVGGVSFDQALQRLAALRSLPGRMERFGGGGLPTVIVDYAHTPDALAQALAAAREHCRGRLYCVFGCGGERDPGKRPLMGAVAEQAADFVFLTDDNPRREDPVDIIEQVLSGMTRPDAAYVERDRRRAIGWALELAGPDDLVLVAGKGHEAYQQIGAQRHAFSDRETVQALLAEAGT